MMRILMSAGQLVLLSVLALAISIQAIRDLERSDDPLQMLAREFPEFRRKLQQGIIVSVGYSSAATYKVPKGGDALPALQKASAAIRKAGGGTINIEAGVYSLSSQWIHYTSSTTIAGAGMTKTVLKLKKNAPRFKYAGILRSTKLNNMVYSDFTIDGNKDQQKTTSASAMLQSSITYGRYGFYADGFDKLTFRRVRIQNCQGYGFDPHGIKFEPTIFSKNIDIQNCEALNNGWDGFTIDQIVGGTVSQNLARDNGRHGFNIVTGTKEVVVSFNTADRNGFGKGKEKSGNGCGYVVNDNFELDTRNIRLINNVATKSNKAGVCVLGAVNTQISGNTFTGGKYCGHFVQTRTKGITFSDNTCSTTQGIFIGDGAKASEITLSGNTGI